MSGSIPVAVTRSSLTLRDCPPALADALVYARQNLFFDHGNLKTTPEQVSYADYDAQTKTCRTYPNALHLVQAAAEKLRLALEIRDERLFPPLDLTRLNLTDYPAVCCQAVQAVAQARSSGLLVVPAEIGTVQILCGLARLLPGHFKVLVTSEEKPAVEKIHAALANALSGETIGIHATPRSEAGRIIVTHLDALKDFVQGEMAYCGHALREFDAWICDQVHRLPEPGHIPFLSQFRTTYCWGLTATPVRADNSHQLNSVIFGPTLFTNKCRDPLEAGAAQGDNNVGPLRVCVFPLLTPQPLAERLSVGQMVRAAYLKNPALGATLMGINDKLPEAATALILADTLRLGIILHRQLPQYTFVHGRQNPESRQHILQRLGAGEIRRVLCAALNGEAIDVRDVDYIIDCSSKTLPAFMFQTGRHGIPSAENRRRGIYVMLLCMASQRLFNPGVGKLQNANKLGWPVSYMFSREIVEHLPFEQAPLLPELGTFPEQ